MGPGLSAARPYVKTALLGRQKQRLTKTYLNNNFNFFRSFKDFPVHGDIIVKLARLIIVQISNALAYLRLFLAHLAEVAECTKALLARRRRRVDIDATGGKMSQVT